MRRTEWVAMTIVCPLARIASSPLVPAASSGVGTRIFAFASQCGCRQSKSDTPAPSAGDLQKPARVTDDPDIFRAAKLMIDRHGRDAVWRAKRRVGDLAPAAPLNCAPAKDQVIEQKNNHCANHCNEHAVEIEAGHSCSAELRE